MNTRLYSRIAMIGAAPETRSASAAVVDYARAHGLFARWPISYLATHGDGGFVDDALLLARAARDFAALLARERRMLVHVHAEPGAGFWRDAAFMVAALAAHCPLVVQLHGQGFDPAVGSLLRHATAVGVSCDAVRLWLRSVARNADVVVLPPPAGVASAQPEAAKQNLVLFLGRLEARKGVYDLLDAIASLRAKVPDVRLVCAGDGDRVGVARHAERLGIADAVKFTGWVGPSGKRALLENAAVLALPAYEAGLPVGLVEAMSAGLPVVASPVGGIPEAVVDGANGYLVAPGDRGGLERSLGRLLTDRALAARLGAAARESALRRFAPERALAPLEALYDSLGVSASVEHAPAPTPPALRKAA
jgi:glycosyltransferase involved in cell wall biosynthesis